MATVKIDGSPVNRVPNPAGDAGKDLPTRVAPGSGSCFGGLSQSVGFRPLGAAERTAGEVPLSRREQEIAVLVARGLTNRQIAVSVHISERTAENHVQHILTKLGFSRRSMIASWVSSQQLSEGSNPPQDLPGGVVTFLVTDVEDSTALWDAHPVEMELAVLGHEAAVAHEVAERGGRLLKRRGEDDMSLSVFARASDALAAAVSLQRHLVDDAGDRGGLRLSTRVVLHSGESLECDGDYYGPTLNRAVRLRGVARAGRVVVSQATAELVRDRLPSGVGLVDAGVRELVGLARAEQVFEVCTPGTVASPWVRCGRGNLPVPVSSFVGREAEVSAVVRALGSTRLVTLVGAGGCGKTRLAVAVASQMMESFHDGVWFVGLAPLRDGLAVGDALASMFGLRESAERDVVAVVQEHLRQRHLLLVVDNCEHLVGAAAAMVRRLLEGAPGLKVLATSREGLGIHGESRWVVSPLAEPEAVSLFLERLGSARAAEARFDGDIEVVGRICRALDGIPLAIELAAARAALMALGEVSARLDDVLGLLWTPGGAGPERHRTVEAAIDWGYRLLDDPAGRALHRLSVFAGGFDRAAAASVCGPGGGDHVDELLTKCFVQADFRRSPLRYRLLEPIRQFARARLGAAGDEDEARHAHLGWCVALAEELEPLTLGAQGAAALDRLEQELDNLRAGLAWAVESSAVGLGQRLVHAAYPLWEFRCRYREGLAWSEAMLDLPGDATGIRSAVARRAGILASDLGQAPRSGRFYEQAVAIGRASGDALHLGRALCTGAMAARDRGDLAWARADLDEALAATRRAKDELFVAEASILLASVAWRQGRYGEAKALAHDVVRRAGDNVFHQVRALSELAEIALRQGDYRGAESALADARSLSVVLGQQSLAITLFEQAGRVALDEGRTTDARKAFDDMVEAIEELGDETRPLVGALLGSLAIAEGDINGMALIEDAADQARGRPEIEELVPALMLLGAARLRTADHPGARQAYQEAHQLTARSGMPWDLANAKEGLAACGGHDGADPHRLLTEADALRKAIAGARPRALDWIADRARHQLGLGSPGPPS